MIAAPLATLGLLDRWLPDALVSSGSRSRLKEVAHLLPLARGLSLECHLGADRGRVDLLTALSPKWGGEELAQLRRAGRGWEGLSALCDAWVSGSDPLLRTIPLVGFELDLVDDQDKALEPYTTCCVQPDFYQSRIITRRQPDEDARVRERARRVLATLGCRETSPEDRGTLDRTWELLPPGAAVMHVAVGRHAGDSFRFVASIPREDVAEFAARTADPLHAGMLVHLWKRVDERESLDVYLEANGEAVRVSGFGSECYASADSARTMLDVFVAEGLCADADRAAALSWIGWNRAALPGLHWPAMVSRRVSAKLVINRIGAIAVKIYLEFYPLFSLV